VNLRNKLLLLASLAVLTSALLATNAQDSKFAGSSSLTRPVSAESHLDADGFIPRWFILEPIRSNTPLTDNAVQEAVKKEYFPDQLTVLPRDGDEVKVGDTNLIWHAVDTKNYNVNLYHFAHDHDAPSSYVLFWAVTIVNSPEELRNVRLAIGSNAASVWWVNGHQVIALYGDRQTVIDDGVSKRLTLKKGPNIIRCAVFNAGGATDFCARFLDAHEKPLKTFTVRLPDAAKLRRNTE
jgi:ribonucleotide reductase alpha subunit